MQIGHKRFHQIDQDSIYCYWFSAKGIIAGSFFLVLVIIAAANLSEIFGLTVKELTYVIPFTFAFSIYVSFGTRLFKAKIIVNRKDKTITSSYIFNINKHSVKLSETSMMNKFRQNMSGLQENYLVYHHDNGNSFIFTNFYGRMDDFTSQLSNYTDYKSTKL